MRSPSPSSSSSLPVLAGTHFRRPCHSPTDDSPFSLSPKTLADIVSSKSIAGLKALGGLDGLAHAFQTDLSAGLCEDFTVSDDADPSPRDESQNRHKSRIDVYGINRIPAKKTRNIFQLMIIALNDKVLVLLCIVAAVSLILGLYQSVFQPHLPGQPRIEWVDSLTIMVAVLIVVVTGAVNDYQKEKQFARLVKKTDDRVVKAIRSGRPTEISVFDILVGDILHISAGSLIPADGVLVTGFSIRCDESSITGEADHVRKLHYDELPSLDISEASKGADPFVISGSKVLEGTGTYLVTGVGINSMHGRLKMDVTERTEATPLQSKLSGIADRIAMAGISVALLLFGVLTVKILVKLPGTSQTPVELVQRFLRIFMISISIIVVAVPEGLPLAVTLALAIGVTRMLKDNNLVRVLAACETMGNATVVCSDKTGTLTMNKMTVTAGRVGLESSFEDLECHTRADGNETAPTDEVNCGSKGDMSPEVFRSSMDPQVRDTFIQSIAINSTALEGQVDGVTTFLGSSTEAALLDFARTWLGMRPLQEEKANSQIVQICPFDSTRKYMATVTRRTNGSYRVYLKGAPEGLLRKCDRILYNATIPLVEDAAMTPDRYQSVLDAVETYGQLALRTIAFACKDLPTWPPPNTSGADDIWQYVLTDMTFLGILAIHDPLRPDVSAAIAQCKQAGVSVRMVTGDNIQTAQAIAKRCGILDDTGVVIEGPQFRNLSESEMYELLPHLQVLARSSPEDKKLLVSQFKELGETVAVTGDGTNDGPALRMADVGFSMGVSGTDVAREASSIVLMDDNFSSIVRAIEWGRSINDAIKKFLHFQLTVNITAVSLTFVSAIASNTGESILSPAQLLWVNLIMDTFAALALATDPPSPSVLQRAPDTKATPLISRTGWKMIIGQAVYQLVAILVLSFKGASILKHIRPSEPNTLVTFVFNTFVWMQLFNLYNNRRLDNNLNVFEDIHKNPYFIGVNIVIITGQVLIVTIGGNALSTTPLSAKEWLLSVLLGAFCMPVAVLIRLVPDDVAARMVALPNRWHIFFRKPQQPDTPGDKQWYSTLDHIRSELIGCTQPRGSRWGHMIQTVSKYWRRADPEVHGEACQLDNERAPLRPKQHRDFKGSRRGSVCAPSVVMVGMVAGGIAGWPRLEQSQRRYQTFDAKRIT